MKKASPSLFLAALLAAQLACNMGAGGAGSPDTVATLNGLYTAAAQTSTAAASSATPGLPLPTGTTIGFPSPTSAVTAPSGPVSRCDAASFVKDVSIPDGTVLSSNAGFTKTWRLQNVGTCTWSTSYSVLFVSGSPMSGPSSVSLPHSVSPGQTIDISVNLTSPSANGSYRGYWKLRNASNSQFGIGGNADTAFWVDIVVKGPTFVAYDFVAHYCGANWENNNGPLPCPGIEDDHAGYVIQVAEPKMENGVKASDPGLMTFPKMNSTGFIAGVYPNFEVKAGDRFKALIGCRYNATNCNVIFRLDYRKAGQTKTLAQWHEIYEGNYNSIDVDLSSLSGETVKFILVVTVNGSPNDDKALWVAPRIVRQGNPPPPTATFTPSATPTATNTATSTPTATATP